MAIAIASNDLETFDLYLQSISREDLSQKFYYDRWCPPDDLLNFACKHGNETIVSILLQHGSTSDYNIVTTALENGHFHIIDILMAYGYDINGNSAALVGLITYINDDKECQKEIDILIEKGMYCATSTYPIIYELCKLQHRNIYIKYFLERGADININDPFNYCMTRIATDPTFCETAELLLLYPLYITDFNSCVKLAINYTHTSYLLECILNNIVLYKQPDNIEYIKLLLQLRFSRNPIAEIDKNNYNILYAHMIKYYPYMRKKFSIIVQNYKSTFHD